MAYPDYMKGGERTEINWETYTLDGAEQDLIKTLDPLKPEYREITKMAESIGKAVLTPMYLSEGVGSDRSQWEDSKESIRSQPPAPLKLAAIIRYGYQHGFQLGRDSFVFDCWAAAFLGYGYRINSASTEVELNGVVVSVEDLYTDSWVPYRKAFGLSLSPKVDFISMVLCHLRGRKSNPWVDKMKSLQPISPEQFRTKHGFDPHRMAEFVTGDCGELSQKLWLYQFIGSIMRTFQPGCTHDHMLVLISAEKGLRKTSLLKAIAKLPEEPSNSSKNYIQLRTLKSQKADQERLRGKAIVNLDECDSAFRGLNSDDLKEVITATTDNYRAAYAATAKDHPRICTLFGTTNTVELIQDLKGDRRIFPIQVSKTLDIDWVTENWEDFWGFYLWAYNQMEAGDTQYRNWLTKPEEALLTKQQSRFKAAAPWMETLEGMLDILEDNYPHLAVKTSDLLAVLGKEVGVTKAHMVESAKALMLTERGYLEGRPKLSSGTQPGKPVLYRGGSKTNQPKLVSRNDIGGAYTHLMAGSHEFRAKKAVEEVESIPVPMTLDVVEAVEVNTLVRTDSQQLLIWGVLQKIESDKVEAEHIKHYF
jgi:Virulence-associated protein E